MPLQDCLVMSRRDFAVFTFRYSTGVTHSQAFVIILVIYLYFVIQNTFSLVFLKYLWPMINTFCIMRYFRT